MSSAFKAIFAATILGLGFAAPVAAGPGEDAMAAYAGGDYATALRLLRPLADQGDAQAQYNLGILYENGQGVQQNDAEAVKWYGKAAEQGYGDAQFNLGHMFVKGLGVPQNYVQAHMWFNLAAMAGDQGAATNRVNVAALMTPAQIAEAQKLAREWKPKPGYEWKPKPPR